MDENSLYSLRRTPPEGYARELRASLQRTAAVGAPRRRFLGKLIGVGVAGVAVGAALSVPSVRAGAQAFLDMFRVVHFAAVPIDGDALQRLRGGDLDLPHLFGDQVQISQQPAASYATPGEAGDAVGYHVYLPTWMPVGWDRESPSVEVLGQKLARVTANTARLQSILTSLDISDVSIPEGLNGKSATIRIPSAVRVKWQHEGRTVELLQSPSPQAEFPSGTNLAQLAEIGLRILGLARGDAYRFAQSIDWRTTLLVPVPVNVGTFNQVTVQGNSGLLLEVAETGRRRRAASIVLWSSGGRVFALQGSLDSAALLEMAQTLQ